MTPQATLTARFAFLLALCGTLVAPRVESCAMIAIRGDATALMGNNEDFVEPGVLWFVPGKPGRFGRVNVGFRDDFAQGSMNEKGLAFDAAVVAEVPWGADPAKPTPKNLLDRIMNECATVEEALAYFGRFNCAHLARSQFLLADASGDAAVVAWLPDAGLSVRRIDGDHLIATNTRLAPSGYRCQRFVRAEQVLRARGDASRETMTLALEAIHQRGAGAFTAYATIYDLRARRVFVHDLANFGEAVSLDLAAELEKKPPTRRIADLFPKNDRLAALRQSPPREDYGTRVTLAAEALDRFVGTYSPVPAPEIRVRVVREGDGLRVENPGQPAARLFPESDVSFRIAPDRGTVTFRVAADGSVDGLTLHKQVDVFARRVGDAAP